NEDYLIFNVFINQIKGNNIIEGQEDFEDLTSLENFENFDEERGTCFGSYFRYHHKDKDALTFKIHYDDLTYVFRRRYYQSNDAIEFFTKNHKSYYFVFKSENDRENCLRDIIAHLNLSDNIKSIIIDMQNNKDSFSNVIGYQASKRTFFDTKKEKLSSLVKKWQDLKISNFELLMWLNLYANRSFSDLSQYPVFPWIIKNYDSEKLTMNPEDFRDLSIPMGLMELSERGEARKEGYIQNYETLKENAEEFADQPEEEGEPAPPKVIPYFFGSHYSNPIYVAHYLTRVFPYSHISIELQGNKFDQSDRLFLEVKNSFVCATEGKCDLREVIGEFYYLPEMFLNMNHLNLGQKEDGAWVEDVVCPTWSDNNAYKFTSILRTALESDYASQNIGKWIDLIFGSKQQGKEGIKALNIYYPDCYEVDVDSIEDIEAKKVKLRMVEFGITPKQIFSSDIIAKKKEPSKKKLCDDILNWKTKPLNIKLTKTGEDIEKMKDSKLYWIKVFEEEERILTLNRKSDEVNFMKILKENKGGERNVNLPHAKTTVEGILGTQVNPNENRKYYFLGKSQNYYGLNTATKAPPMVIYSDKENSNKLTIIQGGFYYSKLVFTNIEFSLFKEIKSNEGDNKFISNYSSIIVENEPYIITAINILDSKYLEKDKIQLSLLLGNEIGNIMIASVSDLQKNPSLEIERKLINNSLNINSIAVSFDMNMFGTCSEDGYVNLYTFTTLKLFRSIYTKEFNCDFIFISTCPLNCIVLVDQTENKMRVYSVNGEFLSEAEENSNQYMIKSPKVAKDSNFSEYLIYLYGVKIILRKLPYLEVKQELTIPIRNAEMTDINEGEKTIYITNWNGDDVVYIKNYGLDENI
ncbi:MAG: hypothetical protein MJ252_23285, partial [archaeon]|nr:hypothetical protein [archaeon]